MSGEPIAKQEEIPEGLLTVREMASWLKVGRSTLYRLMDEGLPFYQVGGRRKFLLEEVQDWLGADQDSLLFRCTQCKALIEDSEPISECPRCGAAVQEEP